MSETGPNPSNPERRLAAIMLTDIVGYSRRMSEDEKAAIGMLQDHNNLLFPIISEHGGRVLKTIGDAILAEFRSVVQAVKCALKIQSELHARNEAKPPEERIEVRIGIHVGDVVVDPAGDMFGDGVNITARIQPLAEPGGVCVSSVVHNQIKNMPEFVSISMGKKHLKNIPEPVEVLRVLPSGPGAGIRRALGSKYRFLLYAALALAIMAGAGFFLRERALNRAAEEAEKAALAAQFRPAAEIMTDAEGHFKLARTLFNDGEPEKALLELETAIDLVPELPETAWTENEMAKAGSVFREWGNLFNKLTGGKEISADALRVEGKLLFRFGDGEGAFVKLEEACAKGDEPSCSFIKERTVGQTLPN